jgi:uncharacterized membrane protein YhaH (DUF805 family)
MNSHEMSPIDWALNPIKKYAVFEGRAPRAEYWWYYLLTVVVGIPAGLLDRALGDSDAIATILQLALLLPWLSVTVRRLHDIDRSGWWLLGFAGALGAAAFAAVIGGMDQPGSRALSFTVIILAVLVFLAVIVTVLIFMVLPGTEGSNRYGPDPYGPSDLEEVFA